MDAQRWCKATFTPKAKQIFYLCEQTHANRKPFPARVIQNQAKFVPKNICASRNREVRPSRHAFAFGVKAQKDGGHVVFVSVHLSLVLSS